jgi:hypothetical protein
MSEEKSGKHHWIPIISAIITAAAVVVAAYINTDAKRQIEELKAQNETLRRGLAVAQEQEKSKKTQELTNPVQVSPSVVPPVEPRSNPPIEAPAKPGNLTQEIDDVAITLTHVHLSGDTLAFDFKVVNNAPGDKRMDLFGAGSFGNGSSRFIADGQEYSATSIRVGNETFSGIVGKNFVSGIPLSGRVSFKGVPRTLRSVDILELAYSYDNLKPAGVFRFSAVSVE